MKYVCNTIVREDLEKLGFITRDSDLPKEFAFIMFHPSSFAVSVPLEILTKYSKIGDKVKSAIGYYIDCIGRIQIERK